MSLVKNIGRRIVVSFLRMACVQRRLVLQCELSEKQRYKTENIHVITRQTSYQ